MTKVTGSDKGGKGGASGTSNEGIEFIIIAGGDGKIRYWNLGHVEASCVVSGLRVNEGSQHLPSHIKLTTILVFNVENSTTNASIGGPRGVRL